MALRRTLDRVLLKLVHARLQKNFMVATLESAEFSHYITMMRVNYCHEAHDQYYGFYIVCVSAPELQAMSNPRRLISKCE